MSPVARQSGIVQRMRIIEGPELSRVISSEIPQHVGCIMDGNGRWALMREQERTEGHRIAETARRRVLASHPEVLDVLVHVDAENDLMGNAAAGLPDRETLLDHLRQLLDVDPPDFERTTLHYLGNRVEAEIFLPPDFADAERLASLRRHLTDRLAEDPWFSAIRLNLTIAPP